MDTNQLTSQSVWEPGLIRSCVQECIDVAGVALRGEILKLNCRDARRRMFDLCETGFLEADAGVFPEVEQGPDTDRTTLCHSNQNIGRIYDVENYYRQWSFKSWQ